MIPVSDPLSRATADLATKERELKALQADIERLRAFIETYRQYADVSDGKRSKKDLIADAAIIAIKENGAPMQLSSLFDAIEARGVEIGTQNPKQYLSTTLNRDERFASIEGKGWSLSNKR